MDMLVSGASGLVGSALVPFLSTQGHKVRSLVRRPPSNSSQVYWYPPAEGPALAPLEGVEAVVHLAGESIAAGRWTEARKRAIRDSRVLGTRLLAEAFVQMKTPPKVFVVASAIGFYGNRGTEILREDSPAGAGFLAEVCRAWEEAAAPAVQRGIRVVHLRLGVILSPKGGALAKMLLPFKLGLGGRIGSGDQYMSWIALDDVLGVVRHALQTQALRGPVNTVAPSPVTYAEFAKMLGKVLKRPTIFPMPAFAARLAFGEMADELLLASTRVEPAMLVHSEYRFRYPTLEAALRHLL